MEATSTDFHCFYSSLSVAKGRYILLKKILNFWAVVVNFLHNVNYLAF